MIRIALPILAILAGIGLLIWTARDLMPPDRVRFAAGIEGGGYWRIAERYREILARDGIDLVLIPTAGSVENARLLESGDAQAGLLQGRDRDRGPTSRPWGPSSPSRSSSSPGWRGSTCRRTSPAGGAFASRRARPAPGRAPPPTRCERRPRCLGTRTRSCP